MQDQPSRKKSTLTAKSALLFGSGTLTSRILGLFRDSLVYSVMPTDMRDAWIAAFRIPNFFRRLLGEGGLSVSFIPLYVGLEDQQQQKRLASGVFSLLLTTVILICLVCFVFMEPLINTWLSGPGFSEVPGKIAMTINMARIMIFFLFFVALFAYFMALLNAHKKFTMSGYAPLFLNVGIIGGLLLFKDSDQLAIAAAWSVVAGVAMQALFLLYPVMKTVGVPKLSNPFNNPLVSKVLKRFLPTFIGVGVLQVLGLINTYFASQLSSGALSHINLGDRLLELPLSLIAVSIGTTLLPTLSGYWKSGNKDQFIDGISRHLSLFYFLALPAAFGLWFLGTDIIDVLFRRGEFTASDVPIVADILKIYCLTLLAAGSLKILNQGLYAMGDTLTPALISIAGLIIHLIMAPRFMEMWQLNGLILSTALTTLFNMIVCSVVIQVRVQPLAHKAIASHFSKCFTAAAAMGGYLYFVSTMSWKQGRFLMDFPVLLMLIAGGGVIYFTAAAVLKVDELSFIKRKFLK